MRSDRSTEGCESDGRPYFGADFRRGGWRTAVRRCPHGKFAIDLTQVPLLGPAGALLLHLMDRGRAALATEGPITGEVKKYSRGRVERRPEPSPRLIQTPLQTKIE